MAGRFKYNTYGPGRTRPLSEREAHWRSLGIKVGMQMRKPLLDPAHSYSPGVRIKMGIKNRQKGEAFMAERTPARIF